MPEAAQLADAEPGGKRRPLAGDPAIAWMLFLFTAIFWIGTVRFDFVWDDTFYIVQSEAIRSLANFARFFTDVSAQASHGDEFLVLRPLRNVHYALLIALGGGGEPKAWLFHLANVLWHAGAVALLYLVAGRLFSLTFPQQRPLWVQAVACFVAVGFAVHPVVTEAVCWAKCLDDLMATVFVLLATWLLLTPAFNRARYGWSLGCFWLAVYSKESVAPYAAVAFALFWLLHREKFWKSVMLSAGYAVAGVVFVAHHHWLFGQTAQHAPLSGSYGQTLLDMFPVVLKYARLGLGVPPFCIDYSYLKGGCAWWSAGVVGGGLLLGAVIALSVLAAVKWRMPSLAVGLVWALAFMLPVSNLMPMMQYMAERFFYLPLAGLLMATGAGLLAWPRLRLWWLLPVLLFWAGLAFNRAGIWKDEFTLFVTSWQQDPPSGRLEHNAMSAIMRLPHMQAVFRVTQGPGGSLQFSPAPAAQVDWLKVEMTLEEMTKLFPHNAKVSAARGLVWAVRGKPEMAVPLFETATKEDPADGMAWTNLGQARYALEDLAGAEQALVTARKLVPRNAEVCKTLSAIYWRREDFARALDMFNQLTLLEPAKPEHREWAQRAKERLAGQTPTKQP